MFTVPVRFVRALPVVPAVLLAGCGVAGTQFHPGVAAQVGDQTITSRHVDEVTTGYCEAVEKVSADQEDQGGEGGQQTPLRYLAHEFATSLVVKAAAEQLAEEYDVTPTAAYEQNLGQLEPQLATLDEDEKDAVREVVGADAYASDVLTQIGEISLQEDGNDAAGPEEQLAAGQELLQEWVADNDVEINPRYSIDFGTAEQVDTDLSYAVSTSAKSGLLPQPDEEYAASLPDHLVCLG